MDTPRNPGALVLALTLTLLLPRAAQAAYAQSDLAGTWRSQTLASGPGEPWWERGQAFVTAGGALTVYAIDNFGDRDTTYGQLVLASDGVVTMSVPTPFHGALDLGTTLLAATDLWEDEGPLTGTTELRLVVKTLGGYVTSDLAGAWEFNSIASGPSAPWWIRGRQTIAADGSFSGSFTESTGATEPVSGTIAALPDGSVTISFAPLALGWLDAGRTVLVMTNTWSDGSTELITGLRMGASYAQADLAGTWQVHSLATGPGAPWWSRGQVTIAGDGAFTGSLVDNLGDGFPVAGTFTLASDGIVTGGSSAMRGALDAGHTVMIWTDTWDSGSPGTTELMVAVRTGGSLADVPPAPGSALSLAPVRPNPARGGALTVRFALADASPARLELIDVTGRAIGSREVGALGAGAHAVTLAAGARLRPGLYFVRLRQGGSERVERVTVLD